jgi:hypothetical protein
VKTSCLILALSIVALSSPPRTVARDTKTRTQLTLAVFPDSVEGLHAFLRSYIGTIKEADRDKRARMDESLRLPEPDRWFATTFGATLGRSKANQYAAQPPDLYPFLDRYDLGPSMEIHISHVEFSNERDAKSSGIPLLTAMEHPVSYYAVYLSYNNKSAALVVYPLFVYVDHAFRLIHREFGQIDEQNRPSCGLEHLYRHRIAAIEESMQRVSPPDPLSPLPLPMGSSKHTTQTVKLFVLVACNGQVLETDYLAGPPELYALAADTVKKWKYAQKFLNGLPVEIDSTVTVEFQPAKTRVQSVTTPG